MFGSTPVPEVFVLWHPRCELGKALAHRIHAWLRPGNGLGPEVFFRCLPAPGEPPGVLPPELPGETRALLAGSPTRQFGVQSKFSNLQIVLPLIDENMIADPTWRHWLGNL